MRQDAPETVISLGWNSTDSVSSGKREKVAPAIVMSQPAAVESFVMINWRGLHGRAIEEAPVPATE